MTISIDSRVQTVDENGTGIVGNDVSVDGTKAQITRQEWMKQWEWAIVRSATTKIGGGRIINAERDEKGRPWQALAGSAPCPEWGMNVNTL